MNLNFDLDLVRSQKVLLTPQVKQVVEVLKMNSQELFEYVEKQLELNPVLEINEYGNLIDESSCILSANKNYWEDTVFSLKDYLFFQLHTSELNEEQVDIGEYLIDNIDENGYLTIGTEEAAAYFKTDIDQVEKVLSVMQNFDPPGILARNLKECLLIQIHQKKILNPNVIDIIENYLDCLAVDGVDRVIRSTGLTRKEVESIFSTIRVLEPKPGREFSGRGSVIYLIPDVIIRRAGNTYGAVLNEDAMPLVNINEYYRKVLNSDVSPDVKKFVAGKLDNAAWLINCIDQRRNIVKEVAELIVKYEKDFFEKGTLYLEKLPLNRLSRDMEIHESIILNTIRGKYLQCSWGVYEMKYFFRIGEDDVSSNS